MNYAIVDIGSNTIRLIIFEIYKNQERNIFDKKYTAGLISYVENGALSTKGIKKLIRTLESIKKIVDLIGNCSFNPFATASLRNLSNRDEVLREVKEKLDIDIDVLSQKEEALMGNVGIFEDFNIDKGLTIDIGGASTEIVSFKKNKASEFLNLQIGSLLLFSQYVSVVIPKKKEIDLIQKKVLKEISSKNFKNTYNTLIGIGGTVRACGKVISELYGKDEKCFSLNELDNLLLNIKNKDKETIRTIIKVNPSRIHTLVPGLIILFTVCKYLHIEDIQVSNKGVREGYLHLRVLEGN